jgi:hypothetical protein
VVRRGHGVCRAAAWRLGHVGRGISDLPCSVRTFLLSAGGPGAECPPTCAAARAGRAQDRLAVGRACRPGQPCRKPASCWEQCSQCRPVRGDPPRLVHLAPAPPGHRPLPSPAAQPRPGPASASPSSTLAELSVPPWARDAYPCRSSASIGSRRISRLRPLTASHHRPTMAAD